ncbi:MAG TPA: branched-chain amino acid ABC transporter substrate-binding protein [Accumulibacter sp.]|uniref:branched-chain amino acid ABC transporter substrate-binding protein n=1 Tax=Accumulibacter sp. TaxID=2053492 RepID=UPI002C518E2F|nr:branched-chain amino acid ABC transporter substrate-binding protein [Accumulibacter sp.]HMV04616.1 branched-chain amino acid ABC transporter substrate-binding protein [Accumulibacter sp.]HMW63113.1 branched-chain amino acid ABC transporter substrate-binding protein [Accumulibacter sp.]HMW80192.1 branched-chain amino acid ABC transporter substrate-binding protein [Accumulibacter sp.]HNB67089.1 branched-chain amino acid ABC transporter substrate-binding protein [Accumulibacter sp.]HNC26178.1 
MNKHILAASIGLFALAGSPAWADHLVAIAGPMTGQYASAGDQIRKGAELAIAEINAKGGVLGQKLKLEVGDDACDPKQAVSVANTMVNKKIVFMHGHWCSSSTIPASDVYNEAQIPMATVSTNPQVTERGLKNIFRIMGRDDQQGLVAGTYLAETFKGKKIAVVDDKSAYGKGLADEIAKAMEAKGAKPALREAITAGEKDYSGLVSKLKSAGVEVMAFGGYHTEVALILRQAQQAGLKLTVVGGDTMTNSELVSAAGPAVDNVMFTFAPDPRKNPAAAAVVKKFRDAKVEPEGYVMYAYAAMQLFAQAADKAKSTKYADLEKTIRNGSFDTVIGKLSFDAKGDNKLPGFMVYQWKGGQYDYVKK